MSDHRDKNQITEQVQAQFGSNAEKYVTSSVHSQGDDLQLLLETAQPQSHFEVLDIATGGGHTALLLAPYVKRVVATDITQKMLDAAQAFITPQADNVSFEIADAESLPFEDKSFDMVTCRIAAHHFADIYKFVLESARVLRPGGSLVIEDHLAPEDERAADYIDAFEMLRDPSHVKAYSETEWRSTYLDAQLTVDAVNTDVSHHAKFHPWVERMNVPAEDVERLEVMLLQAPDAVKDWLKPHAIGTPDATFYHRYLIIRGQKPA